jgi:multiple sugar transport system substrate-binding protein
VDNDSNDPVDEAALSRELDAWLRGDVSRRAALARLLGVAAGGTLLAGPAFAASGFALRHANGLLQQAKVDLAAPDTPLGRAQADAVRASTETQQDGSAYRAVAAAKQFKGSTVTMTYEAGLQALEPRNFSGPLWQDLTGISSNVVELSHPDQYSKPIAEHIAQSGAYDVIDIEPSWIPSLADGGVIAPIDDYVAEYMNKADLEDYHPLYKFLPTYKGKRWGVFDDGDQWALYYRRDLFEDAKLQAAYRAKFNQDLRVPRNWDEYNQVAQFITDQLAPKVYGAAHFRKAGSPATSSPSPSSSAPTAARSSTQRR